MGADRREKEYVTGPSLNATQVDRLFSDGFFDIYQLDFGALVRRRATNPIRVQRRVAHIDIGGVTRWHVLKNRRDFRFHKFLVSGFSFRRCRPPSSWHATTVPTTQVLSRIVSIRSIRSNENGFWKPKARASIRLRDAYPMPKNCSNGSKVMTIAISVAIRVRYWRMTWTHLQRVTF